MRLLESEEDDLDRGTAHDSRISYSAPRGGTGRKRDIRAGNLAPEDKTIIFQLFIVILLIINVAISGYHLSKAGPNIKSEGLVEDAGWSQGGKGHSWIHIKLKNTGDSDARVHVSGTIYRYDSDTMDTPYEIIDLRYTRIQPGVTRNVAIVPKADVDTGSYFVEVYVNWNGGSFVYVDKITN